MSAVINKCSGVLGMIAVLSGNPPPAPAPAPAPRAHPC